MLRLTHMTTSLVATSLLIKEPKDYIFMGVFGIIGSLMPDVDAPNNLIRRIKYFSYITFASLIYIHFTNNIIPFIFLVPLIILSMVTEHRTFTHSLLGLLFFSICVYFINSRYVYAFMLGYAIHLLEDSLTVMGVPMFYPYKKKFSFKLMKTGGQEDVLICIMGILIYFCILSA